MSINTSRFLQSTYHMSLWELAHRWAGENPLIDRGKEIPVIVQDILRCLMWGQIEHTLSVSRPSGHVVKNWRYIGSWKEFVTGVDNNKVSDDERRELYVEYMSDVVKEHDDIISKHSDYLNKAKYDKIYLSLVHVDQGELVDFCIREEIEPPFFWISEEEFKYTKKVYENRINNKDNDSVNDAEIKVTSKDVAAAEISIMSKSDKNKSDKFWLSLAHEQKARLMCRDIAEKLWKETPILTITDITKHEAILNFGGAKYYKGRDTVRNWIKDLDPRDEESKSGRPKK
jgi:hypothetical protein